MQARHIVAMTDQDVVSTRRARLKSIIDDDFDGKQVRFVEKYGVNAGELSGLLRSKHFGEKKARSIEAMLGLPAMWLDGLDEVAPKALMVAEAPAAYGVHPDLITAWDLLTDDERDDFLSQIKAKAAHNQAVLKKFAPPGVITRTVSVSERRLKQAKIPFSDRRKRADNA